MTSDLSTNNMTPLLETNPSQVVFISGQEPEPPQHEASLNDLSNPVNYVDNSTNIHSSSSSSNQPSDRNNPSTTAMSTVSKSKENTSKLEVPESPRSRKRRLNTEKVRKYRQRKRARVEAQLIAEGKPIKGRRKYKKREGRSSSSIVPQNEHQHQQQLQDESLIISIPDIQSETVVPQISSTNLMSPGSSRGGGGGGGGATRTLSYATTDLCDAYINSPARLQAAEAGVFFDYGGVKAFHGQIETVRCFESNPMVRQTLSQPGNNRVLVVDGGGSKRVAIMGDQLASMAHENNWRGVIINGCIRDSKMISTIPVGVKALGTHPLKSLKDHKGERGGLVAFAGLEFHPGHWVYADEDGVIISEKELTLDDDE